MLCTTIQCFESITQNKNDEQIYNFVSQYIIYCDYITVGYILRMKMKELYDEYTYAIAA